MSEIDKFCCSVCKFSTPSNFNLQKHFASKKHANNIRSQDPKTFECKKCDKSYVCNSGLWRHNKICKGIDTKEQTEKNEYQYVYLIQEREFIKTKELVYKIGKTKQPSFARFMQYPKGSVLILQLSCNNCDKCEIEIIRTFKNKYKQRRDIGNEYFEGDYKTMLCDICEISNQQQDAVEENRFNCLVCKFSTTSNTNLQKHFASKKHATSELPERIISNFHCKKCDKYYKELSGLWRHNKVCIHNK